MLPLHCWVISTLVFPHPCLHVQCIWQEGRKACALSCAALSMISNKKWKKQMLFPATRLFVSIIMLNGARSPHSLSRSTWSTRISHVPVSNKYHLLLSRCHTFLLLCSLTENKVVPSPARRARHPPHVSGAGCDRYVCSIHAVYCKCLPPVLSYVKIIAHKKYVLSNDVPEYPEPFKTSELSF